jgi:hypothetical protein
MRQFIRHHWQAILGVGINLPTIWKYFDRALGLGEHIEFIANLPHHFGGIGVVIGFLFDPPFWFVLLLMFAGALLIWWDLRRRQAAMLATANISTAAKEASLGVAVNEAIKSPNATGDADKVDGRTSTEMQFLRRRWLYAIFAGPPFFYYRAKRRLEFIDSWARYFEERKMVEAKTLGAANSIRNVVLENAFDNVMGEGADAIYHLAVTPDQLKKKLIALLPAATVKP